MNNFTRGGNELASLTVLKVIMKGGSAICKQCKKIIHEEQEHAAVFLGEKLKGRFCDYLCQELFQDSVNKQYTIKRYARNPEKEKIEEEKRQAEAARALAQKNQKQQSQPQAAAA